MCVWAPICLAPGNKQFVTSEAGPVAFICKAPCEATEPAEARRIDQRFLNCCSRYNARIAITTAQEIKADP